MDQDLDDKLKEFQSWILTQSDLPQNIGKSFLGLV
jgi:hypothetical protein